MSVLVPPLVEVGCEGLFVHRVVDGGADVAGHDPFEDVSRHRFVHFQVRLHVPGGRGDPGPENYRVDECDTTVRNLVQKMAAKRDGPTDVVARDRRRL